MYYRCRNCGAANERSIKDAAGPCTHCKCFTLERAERVRSSEEMEKREIYRCNGGYYSLSKDKKKFYPSA